MGGSAFTNFPEGSFPRIPPPVYHVIKSHYLARIKELYHYAAVPREAPEKSSHGDLDILVAIPKKNEGSQSEIPHTEIQDVLGATHVIPMPGYRTSNYAVSIPRGEWGVHGCSDAEDEARHIVEEIYYQVDIHVCSDEEEWNRILHFHGYGDLGMILGLIARNNGLHLGEKGLRIPDQPHPPFHLTANLVSILTFFGFSIEQWEAGFDTMDQLYEWCTSAPAFNPSAFNFELSKVKSERAMFYGFLRFVKDKFPSIQAKALVDRKDEALAHFGLTQQYLEMVKDREDKVRFKALFRGTNVSEWIGSGPNWKLVSKVMNEVRAVHGGEQGVCDFYVLHGEEALMEAVAEAKRIVLTREEDQTISV